jgi:phosphoribosylformimino-5-aminoimidazole carboxamide ribotide isomerase
VILYPAIDIRDGHAVRLLRGDYAQETVYDVDPAEAAKRWVDEGARYLHVVDLDGARSGRPLNLEAVERIASSVPVPIQGGGGLRDMDAIEALIDAGAERVVLGTAALTDRELLREAIDTHDERIVVSVDARKGKVVYQGWTQTAEGEAPEAIEELSDVGVRRFVFTPIDVDGTMEGPGIEQLREAAAASEAEIIYSGGVGELDHLRSLAEAAPPTLGGVIVGRALYEKRFTVSEAQRALDSGAQPS